MQVATCNPSIAGEMDGLQLRDEAVKDRIRSAEEFLDPSELAYSDYLAHYWYIVDDARAKRSVHRRSISYQSSGWRLYSYRAEIILMLNRGLRRLIVRGLVPIVMTETLMVD